MKDSKKHPKIYLTRERLDDILSSVGVRVVSETEHDLLCYCPFHHNVDSPAFNMSKKAPYLWKCWNGKCDQRGNIISLLTKKGYSSNEARRMLYQGITSPDDFEELMRELLSEEDDIDNPWEEMDLSKFRDEDAAAGYPARQYLLSRGITEASYDHFNIGYSPKRDMIVVPVLSERHECLGVIGRSIKDKRYMYSSGLSRGTTIFNIENAIKSDRTEIILTEGSLDSIYIHQAGYENVGAVLGSAISPNQWQLLRKHFTDITCFFDNDDAGIALTHSVIKNGMGTGVSVVAYPDDRKDPGELSSEEIQDMVDGRVSAIELLLGE